MVGLVGGNDSVHSINFNTLFMQSFFTHSINRTLGTLVLAAAVVALGAYAYLTFAQAKYAGYGPTTIAVSGEAEVMARPDVGTFSFTVEAEADDAAAAQTASAERMNAVLAYLTEQGIEERDIKTQNYSLQPKYRYEERVCPMGSYCPPGERIADGFMVMQTVSVKVRDLDAAGNIIAGVGQTGATNISSLGFTIDDPSILEAEARVLAIADAEAKAEVLAEALGVTLVRMIGFYEQEKTHYPVYGMGGDMMERSAMEMAVAPDMPVGEDATHSLVTITYEIK